MDILKRIVGVVLIVIAAIVPSGDAAEDVPVADSDAKAAAERDVKHDFKSSPWEFRGRVGGIGGGFFTTAAIVIAVGAVVEDESDARGGNYEDSGVSDGVVASVANIGPRAGTSVAPGPDIEHGTIATGCLLAGGGCLAVPWMGARPKTVTIPSERFTGKTREYVGLYMEAYKNEIESRRKKALKRGMGVGAFAGVLLFGVLWLSLSN